MTKRIFSLIIVSILSLSLIIGCSKTNTPEANNSTDTNIEQPDNSKDNDNSSTTNDEISIIEEQVQAKFEEAIIKIYNVDFSNESQAIEIEEYINENFTPEGAEDMINKIISYGSKVSHSDLLVTLVKKVPNSDSRFTAMYEIRYNITVTFDKSSIYTDIISVIFVDKDGKIIIESLNQNNF